MCCKIRRAEAGVDESDHHALTPPVSKYRVPLRAPVPSIRGDRDLIQTVVYYCST